MDKEAEQAFTDFVTGASGKLLAFSRLLIADRGDAEDALQVALMRLARHWHREIEAPTAYVRQALVNIARDRARRRHLVPRVSSTGRTVEVVAEDELPTAEVRDSLDALLKGLPPRQRVTVVLRVVEGCSEAETAALMGCAPGTVKSNLARGLARLRLNYAQERAVDDDESSGARSRTHQEPFEGASA